MGSMPPSASVSPVAACGRGAREALEFLVSAGGPVHVHGCRGESDFAFGGHDKFGWEPENLCALLLVVAILVEKLCIQYLGWVCAPSHHKR